MDWLTFVSKLIEHAAWPLASVILVLLLRPDIRKLVPLVKKLKAGPVEAEFEREVSDLHEVAAPLQQKAVDAQDTPSPYLLQLAQVHPRSAIIEAWLRVESAAVAALSQKTAQQSLSSSPKRMSGVALAEALRRNEILHEGQLNLFHELRNLRNDVVHIQGLQPSDEAVRRYLQMAAYLQWWLEEGNK